MSASNVEWEPSALYLYYDVALGGPPQGANATDPEFNDCVELYVSGQMAPAPGDYGPNDLHLVVDQVGARLHVRELLLRRAERLSVL